MPINSIPDYALLKEQTLAYLKHALCDTLSLPAHQLDEHTAFERYGLDSILVVQLTNTLRETFTNISTTVFFECNTLAELSKHLLKTETAALLKLFGTSEPESKPEPSGGVALQPPHRAHPGLQSRRGRRFSATPGRAATRDCYHRPIWPICPSR